MNDLNESLMLIDPEILQKELVISLPILSESDIEMMLNVDELSSNGSTSDEDEKEKPCLKRDQRRLTLLNNPMYGIVLCFMEKFRSYINFKKYPLRIFEDNLISEKEKISGRFMDFHLTLLKKISPSKTMERNQFAENMAKFAYRFDNNDGDQLNEHGYAKAKIDIKLRLLKNLLEQQFDRNQSLKNAVVDKSSFDIRSKPFGRDRYGGSYWLFTDIDCFVRLFREDIDENRTWINLAKNSQEVENVIKLLISDYAVRKKFSDWKFSKESFNNLSSTNKFEDEYGPNRLDIKKKSEEIDNQSAKSIIFGSTIIKPENINLDPVVNLDRDIPASPPAPTLPINNIEIRNILDNTSDQESIGSEIINGNRLRIASSSLSSSNSTKDETHSNDASEESIENEKHEKPKNDDNNNNDNNYTMDEIYSNDVSQESIAKEQHKQPESSDDDDDDDNNKNGTRPKIYSSNASDESSDKEQGENSKNDNNDDTQVIVAKPLLEQGIKRKLVDYDDTESEIDSEKNVEISQESQEIPVNNEEVNNNADLPIALRRSRRGRRSLIADYSADSSSTSQSLSQDSRKKRDTDGRWKRSNQSSKSKNRRRRSRKANNGFSSTTSDERQPSEDDFSDEYLVTNTEQDKLLLENLPEEENDDNDDDDNCDDYIPCHRAKTVAQCHEQFPIESKPCISCSKTDRPEFLLLCEDCNDAYHLECIQPELFSIPDDMWYCSLCEHKHLCDNLIEKLIVLIKDEEDFEMKRRLYVSKRRKRLTNVTVNLDRFVNEPEIKKPKSTKKIISSDEDDKESEKKPKPRIDDDDDDDSVYGCKNDENRKPSDQEEEQTGKRRVRSCRRKAQNYSLEDYDKKIKEAMIGAGVNKELIENDSEDSDDMIIKRKPSKKRARYEEDDDFNISDTKNGDIDFVPSRRRNTNNGFRIMSDDSRTMNENGQTNNVNNRNIHDDSRSDGRDNDDYDDYGMSDDDIGCRNRRQSSTSSIPKKKSNTKSNRNYKPKSLIISDEDTISYDPNETEVTPAVNVKTEPTTDFVQNEFPANVFGKTEIVKNVYDKNRIVENVVYINEAANINKPRRQRRAPPKKKKPTIQEENISEEEKSRPPPTRRLPARKRRGSNDSSIEDDDDYEKLVHKRRLFSHGKAIVRSSITGHIKKLLGQEDDDEEEEEGGGGEEGGEEAAAAAVEENENEKESKKDKSADEKKKDKNNNSSKQANKNSQYDELRLSDDDDFPDEQEILKTTGLLSLKNPPKGPKKPAPVRAPFMPSVPSMQSYQFAMVDPTAQFEFTCPPEAPITEPSDSGQANGDNSQATAT